MPDAPITREQAAEVDRVLEQYQRYLKRLSIRLRELGVQPPHCLPKWVGDTEWSIGGLRIHFAQWACGCNPDCIPKNDVPLL